MPLLSVGDVQLYYEIRGEGPPLLVLLGLPAVVSDVLPFVERLADDFTVIVYDNRGSGGSDKPESWYTIKLFAEDAAGLLDALGVASADVFGFSMGAMIAQELALNFPQKVGRLVLGCTPAGGSRSVPPADDIVRAFTIKTEDWSEWMRALAPFAFSPSYARCHPEVVAGFIAKKSADVQPYAAYRRQLGAINRHDAYDRLSLIAHLTLVISGTEDVVVPAENARLLADRIPNARLTMLEGAGHLFFLEQPDATLAAI